MIERNTAPLNKEALPYTFTRETLRRFAFESRTAWCCEGCREGTTAASLHLPRRYYLPPVIIGRDTSEAAFLSRKAVECNECNLPQQPCALLPHGNNKQGETPSPPNSRTRTSHRKEAARSSRELNDLCWTFNIYGTSK